MIYYQKHQLQKIQKYLCNSLLACLLSLLFIVDLFLLIAPSLADEIQFYMYIKYNFNTKLFFLCDPSSVLSVSIIIVFMV